MEKMISISNFPIPRSARSLLPNYKHSIKIWKLKIEQVKLLMQIKHNGYLWLNNTRADVGRIAYRDHNDNQKTPTKHERKNLTLATSPMDSPHFLYSPVTEGSLLACMYQKRIFQQSPTISLHTTDHQFFSDSLRDDCEDNEISLGSFLF
jgi:hypothetical protein